jgi:membrane protein DedA with SNARE-associated domain
VGEHLYHTLTHFFARYGYGVVFFGVMLENAGLPIPGETVLLFAGFLAFQGHLRLPAVVITAIVGATAGDSIGYLLGRKLGSVLLQKHRRWFFLSADRFERAQHAFVKYGHWAVFVARFITGLRVLAGPFAGAFQMPYPRFLFFNFSGAVLWATVMGCVGYYFGGNWKHLVNVLKKFDLVTLVGLGLVIAVLVYRRKRNAR